MTTSIFKSFFIVTASLGWVHAQNQTDPILGHETLGDGPEKVIVLHDWLGNADTWNPVKPYLKNQAYTFVFAEVRGYGRSKAIIGDYTVDEIAGDVLRLAKHLGMARFHFIGHSMTGMVGQKLAIDDENRAIARLISAVLVTPITATGYPATAEDRQFFESVPHNQQVTAQAFAGLTGGRHLPAWGRHKAALNIASSTKEAMQGYRVMVLDGGFELLARQTLASTPMLVIGGRHDLPGVQEDYLRKTMPLMFPASEIKIIEAAGHYPTDETPIELATLIIDFLDRHRQDD